MKNIHQDDVDDNEVNEKRVLNPKLNKKIMEL